MTKFVLEGRGYYRCTLCRKAGVVAHRRKNKKILVDEAGGKCIRCGYDRYIGALQFHHRDPSIKERGLSKRGLTISIARLREEAKKCDLLCANCHAEVEGNFNDA